MLFLLYGSLTLSGPAAYSQPTTFKQTTDAADSLTQAKEALRVRDLDRAEQLARKYLDDHAQSPDAMFLLGGVLEGRKQPKESLGWFTKGAAIRQPSGEDLRLVGMDYVLLEDYVDALTWLTRSVAFTPENAEAWYDLGRVQMMQGKFDEAEISLQRALRLQPRMVKAEDNLGVVYEAQNRIQEAEESYHLAVEWQKQAPHPSEQPLLNYGVLLLNHMKVQDALPLLRTAQAIAPDDVRCNEELALALDRQGDIPGAVEFMERAVSLAPEKPSLHYEFGQILKRAGEPVRARQELTLSGRLYGTRSSEDSH